jgi:RNA-directed DNA polymerase
MKPRAVTSLKGKFGPIRSVRGLCNALGLSAQELVQALKLDEDVRFQRIPEKRKPDGTVREIYNPHQLIRKIQRRLVSRLFSRPGSVVWPTHLYGSIPNQASESGESQSRDYVACSARHCGAKSLLKLDIKDFFGNVHAEAVYCVFRDLFGYGERVSKILTCICTHKGSLPQGGLTSSYLAMLSLHDVESYVVERLRVKGLVYTRYVDDITISSKNSKYDFGYAMKLVEDMLMNCGLPLNHKKTRIQRITTSPLTVHGLRVAFDTPRLQAEEIGRIRSAVKQVEVLYRDPGFKFKSTYRKAFNRCMGRVNKLKRVGHSQHRALHHRLLRVLPLASGRDLIRANSALARLERDYSAARETFGFHRRFHLLQERLNLIQRTHPAFAEKIRARLRQIKPEFE